MQLLASPLNLLEIHTYTEHTDYWYILSVNNVSLHPWPLPSISALPNIAIDGLKGCRRGNPCGVSITSTDWEAGPLGAADSADRAGALHEVGEAGAYSFMAKMAASTRRRVNVSFVA